MRGAAPDKIVLPRTPHHNRHHQTLHLSSPPTPPHPRAGTWLVLKNCHLVTAWLRELEKELHSLPAAPVAGAGGGQPSAAGGGGASSGGGSGGGGGGGGSGGGGVHPGFRLFLTSEPHPSFPASLLEACAKVRRRRRRPAQSAVCAQAQSRALRRSGVRACAVQLVAGAPACRRPPHGSMLRCCPPSPMQTRLTTSTRTPPPKNYLPRSHLRRLPG